MSQLEVDAARLAVERAIVEYGRALGSAGLRRDFADHRYADLAACIVLQRLDDYRNAIEDESGHSCRELQDHRQRSSCVGTTKQQLD